MILLRYGQPRSGPDRDRPRPTDFGPSRVEPIKSVRLGPGVFPGPIGPVHLDLWDRLDRSFCSMITSLIHYVNTYCHATSYLFTTSKHIVIGCFRFTSSLCLCLQPCDRRLLLLRLQVRSSMQVLLMTYAILLIQPIWFLICLICALLGPTQGEPQENSQFICRARRSFPPRRPHHTSSFKNEGLAQAQMNA